VLLLLGLATPAYPPASLDTVLEAPIKTWDEGIPLGNGLQGALLWGEGNELRVSLDRGDLWDERPADGMRWEQFTYRNLERMVRAGDQAGIDDIFERAYYDVHPTKLPAGRLVLNLGPRRIKNFRLRLAEAEGEVATTAGAIRAIWSADERCGVFWIPGTDQVDVKLMTPAMVALGGATPTGPDSHGVGALGYPLARFVTEGNLTYYEQEAAQGLRYVVMAGQRPDESGVRVVVTVTSTADGQDPVSIARRRVRDALAHSRAEIEESHHNWWQMFWSSSAVELPDKRIAKQYAFVRYLYGAGSRQGSPPMPLQGVWTADAGSLPPWKGDYHNDLNTQTTYLGYLTSGDFASGRSWLDYLWDRRDRFRRFAREFYETPGLSTPGVMTLSGDPLAGWVQYSLSPTMTAWTAHLFYLHWRYTADDRFLRDRAYPWCKEAAECIAALLREEDGRLVLPLSSSPEIFDNSARAWLEPNSNYDLMSMRMLFLALAEMATAQGMGADAERWTSLSNRLGDYHVREDGTLKLNEVEDLPGSHRHLSNLMGIHPFNLINVEQGYESRRRIRRSIEDWERHGTSGWTGYSFAWMAALRARIGDGEEAWKHLDIYAKAFVLRNGFHANGDQSGEGYSSMTYRPFTLEGNFLAMHAVHEMLLQSWSPTPGRLGTEVLRIFPAVPTEWGDVSFRDLRAEDGYRVSARRVGGQTVSVSVTASRSGELRLLDNFGEGVVWSKPFVRRGGRLEFALRAGETLIGTRP